MTPEREKKLRDSLGWTYDPSCHCGLCAEYLAGLPKEEGDGIAIVGLDFVDVRHEDGTTECVDVRPGSEALRTMRRLAEPAARVGTNALSEGSAFPPDDAEGEKFHPPSTPFMEKLASESDRRKATPIFSGVMRYFPDALAAVARLSKAGNDKHNPGQPLHWARGKSTDHGDCIARHQITFEQIDPETGEYHAAAVAWRALAQLQLLEEKKQKEAAEPKEPEWQKWLPGWMVKPIGRVEFKMRGSKLIGTEDADKLNWGEFGAGTIIAYRPAWSDKRRAA